jgi:hypothetical protein
MIYTEKWAFIHIPKTSGMNFKINALNHFKEIIKPYEDNSTGYLYMHNPYSYWEFALQNKWVFSFVRNPFSRAVSLWKFRNKRKDFFNLEYVDFYHYYTDSFFKEGLDGLNWTPHLSQFDFLKNKKGELSVDFYKMETDLADVEKKLNFRFSHTEYNKLEPYDYKEIYQDKKNKQLIQEKFELDFRTFGYDIDVV